MSRRPYYKTKKQHRLPVLFKMIFVLAICTYIYMQANSKDIPSSISAISLPENTLFYVVSLLSIIVAIWFFSSIKKAFKRRKLLKSGIYAVDRMSGVEFEQFLKAGFERLGYKVSLTPTSGDYGVDLICKSPKGNIVVQAKRYKQKVGIAAVQEIVGGTYYYNCRQGMVVTNSYYTQAAKNLAKKCNIILWNRNDVINKLCTH